MMTIFKEYYIRAVERGEYLFKEQEESGFLYKHFKNWKKAIEKMKAQAKSEVCILSCEAEKVAVKSLHEQRDPLFNNPSKLDNKKR